MSETYGMFVLGRFTVNCMPASCYIHTALRSDVTDWLCYLASYMVNVSLG